MAADLRSRSAAASSPRHVLLTADPIGGVWTHALDLARALVPHGVGVALATMGAPLTREQRRAAHAIPNLRLHESRLRLEWMDDPWADVDRAGDWLLALADAERVDVVHLNGFAHAALPWARPTLVGVHSCVCSWWRAVHGVAAPPRYDEYRRRVAAGLRAARHVVAPTRAILDLVLAEHRVPLASSEVIPNGRTLPRRRTPAPREELVLTAGRLWDEGKNVACVVRAAPRLPWPVFVAGDLVEPGAARDAAIGLRGVHALGRLESGAMAEWMRRATIFALPARYEPFGLAPLEAALAGCTLVLGDIPTLRELWEDAALYVEPDDDEALAAAVDLLSREPALRATLAARALARARRMTPAAMAARYVATYAALCAAPAHAGQEVACAS